MKILSKERLEQCLFNHYKAVCVERESDVWYESPASNVIVFERDGRFISLKAHILTGEVTEYIEEKGE